MKRSRNDRTVVRRPVFFFRRKLGARRSSSRAQKWENRRSSLDQRLAWYRRICTSDNSRTSVYHRPSCAGPVGTVVRSKKIRSSTVWTTSAIKPKISETFCWEWVWLERWNASTGATDRHAVDARNNHYAINTMLNDYRTHLVVYLLDPLNVVDREIKM